MSTIVVSDSDFEEKVVKSELPVLVDFWAPWCGPCQLAGPILEELSVDYDGKVAIAKVNIDENQENASKLGVMSIPTVVMYKDGVEIDRKIGFGGKQGYEEMIKKVI